MEESQQGEDHQPLEFKNRIDLGQLQTSVAQIKTELGRVQLKVLSKALKVWIHLKNNDRGFGMFRYIRRWFERYKKFTFDSYDPPKPTIYKLGDKKYVKVKRLRTNSKSKGPYIK